MAVRPDELDGPDGPRPLRLVSVSSTEVADAIGGRLIGPPRAVLRLGLLSSLTPGADALAVYAGSARWVATIPEGAGATVIASPTDLEQLAPGNTGVAVEGSAESAFARLVDAASAAGWTERVAAHVDPTAVVHPRAVLDDDVWVGARARIDANAVVLSGTVVMDGAHLKPGCVLGGDGFQSVRDGDDLRIIGHLGGVWIGRGAQVGANTCIDRGYLGEWTVVGDHAQIDNLCHLAHSVRVGRGAAVIALNQLAGSSEVGDGAWIGPSSTVNQRVRIGAWALVGSGSAVYKDVVPHALAFGVPARQTGWVCRKRQQLDKDGEVFRCPACDRRTTDPTEASCG